MTTVITDGTSMAADGQLTAGKHIISTNFLKMRRLQGRFGTAIVGFAGTIEACYELGFLFSKHKLRINDCANDDELITGLYENIKLTTLGPKDTVEFLMITSSGGLYTSESGVMFYPLVQERACLGSGGHFALAAHMAGASLRDAVKIAAKLDIGTGGTIREFSL